MMSHPETNQTAPESASLTGTMRCGENDGADIVMPGDSSAKPSDRTDAFASAREDDKDDDDNLPALVSDTTDYDENHADSRQVADKGNAETTSSDSSANTSEDDENGDELPELVSDAADHQLMPLFEPAGENSTQLPPLVDDGDSDLMVANPAADIRLVDDEDSDFNVANLSTNTILVDYGASELNVANASSNVPSVDDEDSKLNLSNPSAGTPLVKNVDSDFNAANISTDTVIVNRGDDFNATHLSINTQFIDDEDSNIDVVTPSADTPPTSVDTAQSDDDDMPDLVPEDGVYEDLPHLVDGRGSEPHLSYNGSSNWTHFMVHDGQRCNRKASDCDKCTSIIEQQNQHFVEEMTDYCVEASKDRPELAQEWADHGVKANEHNNAQETLKPKEEGEGELHIAVSLLFLVAIGLMDNSWTTAITLLFTMARARGDEVGPQRGAGATSPCEEH